MIGMLPPGKDGMLQEMTRGDFEESLRLAAMIGAENALRAVAHEIPAVTHEYENSWLVRDDGNDRIRFIELKNMAQL